MKAVICPVCSGTGKICTGIDDHNNTASINSITKDCHGCDSKGWVEVNEDNVVWPWAYYYPGANSTPAIITYFT